MQIAHIMITSFASGLAIKIRGGTAAVAAGANDDELKIISAL